MASNTSVQEPSSPTSPTCLAGSFRLYDPATSKPSSKPSSKRSSRSNLSIDLSSIPPLMTPSPPTNTLLITNLKDADIFRADHLQGLRDVIASSATLASWAPLKSFARIVCSFYSEEDAIKAPESQKLFFISPPPSPPVGWESRNEEPPNTLVMPEDLASALSKLSWNTAAQGTASPVDGQEGSSATGPAIRRQRSGSSTVLFEPSNKDGMTVPGVTVDDFSDDEGAASPAENPSIGITHTSRPPIETIHDA
ncbi:hypothetical protein TWF970_000251 [Orbilia oligospora]|uniref:Calcipressin-like protein n=1 Tax=Orbilia oligospora TaxID=2813651 RepID=A0A7C8RJV5_ORBOL|nr:hypothetical protein TWF970_000251 [Orbilia oligospora]